MVRAKLEDLKAEIVKYVGLPYFKNSGRHHVFSPNNSLVGKGNAKEIALKTVELANEKNIKLLDLTGEEIYKFQKKNHIGIDCSGLAVNLLNFYFNTNIDVRKTSADMLTSKPISTQVDVSEATTGDIIRFDGGKHVLFIIEKVENTIFYVHSSEFTKVSGVHFGTVEIDSDNSLVNWSDESKTGKAYSDFYNPQRGDGIFRVYFSSTNS